MKSDTFSVHAALEAMREVEAASERLKASSDRVIARQDALLAKDDAVIQAQAEMIESQAKMIGIQTKLIEAQEAKIRVLEKRLEIVNPAKKAPSPDDLCAREWCRHPRRMHLGGCIERDICRDPECGCGQDKNCNCREFVEEGEGGSNADDHRE